MRRLNWTAIHNKVLPIGLDIGHNAIRMVQLAMVNDGIRVVAVERAPAPAVDGASGAPDRDDLIRTIRQMLARSRFRGRNVVSTLPNEHLWITSVRLADAEVSAEDRMLRKEAAQRFGLNPDTDAIQYLPAGSVLQGEEAKREYIVLAAADGAIRDHVSMLEEAGLKPVGIDAAPCALFRNVERLLRRQEDRERTIVFVDVGYYYTTVVFGRTGDIFLIKQMAFGAARFDEDIAAKLEVSKEEAQSLRLKVRSGQAMDPAAQSLVAETLRNTAELLAGEIALCLRYYSVTFRGKRIERAVVAGGGAYEPVLLEVIQRQLSVETEVAEPLRGFDLNGIPERAALNASSADLALAVGLCLKGLAALPAPTTQTEPKPGPEPVLEGRSS
jgi:type IV pilus assembly protein PilM